MDRFQITNCLPSDTHEKKSRETADTKKQRGPVDAYLDVDLSEYAILYVELRIRDSVHIKTQFGGQVCPGPL